MVTQVLLHENLFISTCSFHWNWKRLKICLKAYDEKLIYWIDIKVVGAHWNCLNEAIQMCTNNICYWNLGNLFWNIHLSRIMSVVFASFKHLKLPISIKIPVTQWQIVYSISRIMSHLSPAISCLVVNSRLFHSAYSFVKHTSWLGVRGKASHVVAWNGLANRVEAVRAV